MTALDATSHASAFSYRFTDADELACAVRDAGIEYLPLEAGPYQASLTALEVGSMCVQRVEDRAHIVRGSVDLGRAGLLFSVRHTASPMINGCPVGETDLLVLSPGSELHGFCPTAVDWASLSIPAEDFERLLELGGLPAMKAHVASTFLVPHEPAAMLRRAVIDLTTRAGHLSEPGTMIESTTPLADGLMELCMEAFSSTERRGSASRATRDAIRLLSAAEEFLRANITRPIYTDELCKALAVSPRKLHHAFIAACGMSPHAYLKRRRLMVVHQILRMGGSDTSLVKSVALAHGFWHLGNFARDYREQFGQSPSETLAQSRRGHGSARNHAA